MDEQQDRLLQIETETNNAEEAEKQNGKKEDQWKGKWNGAQSIRMSNIKDHQRPCSISTA